MSNLLEVAKHALEAMEDAMYRADTHEFYDAKEALRQAIEHAAPAQPVAWIEHIAGGVEYNPYHKAALKLPEGMRFDLYTTPPQRKPLTMEQLHSIREHQRLLEELGPVWAPMLYYFAQSIERAHGIGGGE